MDSAVKSDADWSLAIRQTIALWLFVVVLYLPIIISRYQGDLLSVALDSATITISVGLGLLLFAVFRATLSRPLWQRALTLGPMIFLLASGQATFDLLYTGWVAHHIEQSWASFPQDFARSYISAFNYVCAFSVNLALFHLAVARRAALRQERQLSAAKAAAQQAQLEALRLQLNPHFLFNTLNAISAMIVTRRNEQAERMTERLSSFLRSALSFDPAELVTLEEELALIDDYLEIEQARFGDRLRVEILCEPAAGVAAVPALLIQPLVENAIKYAVSPSRDPVAITVRGLIDDGCLCITVHDDGSEENAIKAKPSTGVGLKNVRQRLAALYGERATLWSGRVDGGFEARICIPGIAAQTAGRHALVTG